MGRRVIYDDGIFYERVCKVCGGSGILQTRVKEGFKSAAEIQEQAALRRVHALYLWASGMTVTEIAEKFKISSSRVGELLSRSVRDWRRHRMYFVRPEDDCESYNLSRDWRNDRRS